MDADEFRKLGYQLIDWIADYRENIEPLAVMSRARPGEIRARLPKTPPEHGNQLRGALERLPQEILPGITHWNHPAFFAYFPSNTSYASILGDLLSAGLGAQGMSWQTSPAVTEVEEVMMDWLRQMLALPETFTGVIHDTASTATLCALLCARERTTHFAQNQRGLQGGEAPLVVYASDQAHSSVPKAALLAGFGKQYLRFIETDESYALKPSALEQAILADQKEGLRPCAIVATTGTTATTAVDPIREIAGIAKRNGLWLHVDAALAGTAMVLPEKRFLWEGAEEADSIVMNPHKWMGTGFDLSAYFVQDPEHLIRVMSTNPSYLRTSEDGQVKNFRDWHIQLGRRFRALKLWLYLLDVGVEGLRARLRRDIENASWLKEQVDQAADWERVAPVPLQTVCLRHKPAHLRDEQALSEHNHAIARTINESGKAYLTPSDLRGKTILRVSVGAERTERHHLEALWQLLQQTAQSLTSIKTA